jgi:hypothetical protein
MVDLQGTRGTNDLPEPTGPGVAAAFAIHDKDRHPTSGRQHVRRCDFALRCTDRTMARFAGPVGPRTEPIHAHVASRASRGGGTAGGGESLFMSDYGCVAVLEAGRAGHYGQQTIAAETRQGAFAGAGRHRMTGGCLKISSFPTRPRCWARSYAPGGLFAWGNRQDCCGRRKSIRRRCWCAVLHGRQPPRRLKRCQPCLAFVSSGEVVSPQHGETIREIASVRLKGFARACRNKHCVAQAARDKTAGHWWK